LRTSGTLQPGLVGQIWQPPSNRLSFGRITGFGGIETSSVGLPERVPMLHSRPARLMASEAHAGGFQTPRRGEVKRRSLAPLPGMGHRADEFVVPAQAGTHAPGARQSAAAGILIEDGRCADRCRGHRPLRRYLRRVDRHAANYSPSSISSYAASGLSSCRSRGTEFSNENR
jgi:hypothetical protein